MGIDNPPDIFQQKMNYLFHEFEFIHSYIENLFIWKKRDWLDHVKKLESTLNKLKGKVLKYNITKSFFVQTKMEYLGFWVTSDGVKPINKKIVSIKILSHLLAKKKYDSL